MKGTNIKFEKFYKMQTPRGDSYKNLVVSVDLQTHRKILKQGFLIFGFSEARTYEYVNALQCNRCLKYGHFARAFTPSCKKCTLPHDTKECTSTTIMNNINYVNCLASNKLGANYSVRHRPTDERCQSRIERMNALKLLHLAKN